VLPELLLEKQRAITTLFIVLLASAHVQNPHEAKSYQRQVATQNILPNLQHEPTYCKEQCFTQQRLFISPDDGYVHEPKREV